MYDLPGAFPPLTEEKMEALTKNFTPTDVLKALKAMGPLKAPGPNGFQALFFQQY